MVMKTTHEERLDLAVQKFNKIKDPNYFYDKFNLGRHEATAAWVALNEDASDWQKGGQACHGNLSSIPDGLRNMVLTKLIIGGWKKSVKDKEDQKIFLNWLILESPWRDAFPSKNIDLFIKYECVPTSGHVASNILGAACTSVRMLYESNRAMRCQLMIDLMKSGMSGDMAFLIQNFLNYAKFSSKFSSRINYNLTQSTSGSEHNAIQPRLCGKGYVKNFLSRKIVGNLNKTWYEDSYYRGYGSLWGSDDSSWFYRTLYKTLDNLNTSEKSSYSNPFSKCIPKDSSIKEWPVKSVLENAKLVESKLREAIGV